MFVRICSIYLNAIGENGAFRSANPGSSPRRPGTQLAHVAGEFVLRFIPALAGNTLTLSLVGVYSLRASLVDCAVAAAFGMLGFILRRLELPLVPIVLGMVLGRILDEKFRASLARVETPLDFIDRPVSGTIFAIIAASLLAHAIALVREHRARKARSTAGTARR